MSLECDHCGKRRQCALQHALECDEGNCPSCETAKKALKDIR